MCRLLRRFFYLFLLPLPLLAAEAPALLDGMAAHVNAHVITIGDVMTAIMPRRQALQDSLQGQELDDALQKAYDDTLSSLIDRYLLLDAYKDQDGEIPEAVIDQRVEEVVKNNFGGDRSALMEALSKDKLTYKKWREGVREHLIVATMRRMHVSTKINVSPVDVRREYNGNPDAYRQPARVKLRMITLTPKDGEDADALAARAAATVVEARNAPSFGDLARELSSGPKAADGGDWGWLKVSDLRPELGEVLAAMEKGAVSDAIPIAGDVYILRLDDSEAAATVPFADVQADIERELRTREGELLFQKWLALLREQAYIKRFNPGKLW